MSCSAIPPWNESAIRRGCAAGELDREPAELGGERDVRAEQLEILGADDRDVDRVRDEPAVERGDDLLRDDHAGAILRLVGRGGEMRGDDDRVELEQLAGVGLRGEDVERSAGDAAASGSASASAASSTSSPRAALTIRTPVPHCVRARRRRGSRASRR